MIHAVETLEVEPRIAKQYKCHYSYVCKTYRGKVMGGGKTVSLHRFQADQAARGAAVIPSEGATMLKEL